MRLLKPITGLVFAIDFRHNGKDAWYRTAGSLTGTLGAGASITGGKFVGVEAANSYLSFAEMAAPGQTGAILIDYSMGALTAASDTLIEIKPNSANDNNRTSIYRTAGGVLQADIKASDASVDVRFGPTIGTGAIARETVAVAWNGFTGSGTATGYLSRDGGTPVTDTATDKSRTETVSTGTFLLGAITTTTHLLLGSVYRLAIFNITNPAGQDLTAAGWSAATIWDAIFPRTRYNGMST